MIHSQGLHLQDIRHFCALLAFKTWANLRAEVSHYYLNYAWWVVDPLLSMLVYYAVFGIMLNRGTEHFLAFLLCGLVPWQWFQNTVNNASGSIYGNTALFLQVNIAKCFFPLEVLLRDTFKHMLALLVLLFLLIIYPAPFVSTCWLYLPLLLGLQFLFNGGVALLAAAIVPFVPDLRLVIQTLLTLTMFVSGIFFRLEDVVLPRHQALADLNPMFVMVQNYRKILMFHESPDFTALAYVLALALLLLAFGFCLLRRLDKLYPRICLR